jgi:uncharacterized protein involved in outer membrane biogenesis
MRKWIIAGVILIVLAGVAVAALLNLNSLIERNRDFLIAQAEQALGRKVSVGEVQATLWGGIGVRLTDFAMSDDPVYSADAFVRARDLQVNLQLWPLLKREFQIKRVVLHDPVIRIVRGAKGEFNFSTIGKGEKDKKPPAVSKDKEPRAREEKDRPPFVVALVNISNGDIRYVDKKEGADLQVRRIDLGVEDFDFDRPFSVRFAAALFADKQNVRLAGKVGPLGSGVDLREVPLDGEMDIDALDLTRLNKAMPMLRRALPKELDLSGVFSVKKMKFSGKLKDLALAGEIDGTRGALRYGTAVQKDAGIPLALSADARYAGDRLSIRRGRLTLHTLRIAASGDVQLGDVTAVNLSLDSEPASLDGWEKIFPAIASYRLAGTTALKATIQGRAGKGSTPKIEGTLDLKKASAQPPGFPKAIENLDTSIRFTGQKADIKDMTLTLGQAKIRLAAAVEQFAPLALSYKMSTPALWPADYQASLPDDRKADVIRNLTSEGRFAMAGGKMVYQGRLSSGDGMLYNVAYKNLDATLSLADEVAQIRSLRVNTLSGAVQADGEYAFKDPAPRFALATKFQGVDLKELYTALDAKAQHDIRGRLNADMKLSGGGKTWEDIKPALRGRGEAEVVEGALLNFNIAEGALGGITGIPGLANVFSPALRNKYPETFAAKDTEFKELRATLDLANGRINVKDLRMAAADFTVQGDGWANFDRRLDFRATLRFSQPLSADLSRSTREISYLFNNRNELEIPFALAGTMPNVKPRPDTRYLAEMAQRGFLKRGAEELQRRFLGGGKEPETPEESPPADGTTRRRPSTEDRVRKALEGLFGR